MLLFVVLVAYGVSHCGLVDGRTPAGVRRLLGDPSFGDDIRADGTYWSYDGLVVVFADGRVAETDVGP